ncbi:MAG TPA: ROK family protein [Anaerolineales bacterium]|nr:ROK family protein [Anaerolineales bacterium]
MRQDIISSELLAIGIEIGGTKTQVGIGSADGKLLQKGVLRKNVDRTQGAAGIREDLLVMVKDLLLSSHLTLSNISKIGIGFGGILDSKRGVVLKSYQIEGWDRFPLKEWAEKQWGKQVIVQNDASTAGLAESLVGSGRGCSRVFYMTIGSGIGGAWIVDGKPDNGQGFGAAEIGHMWVPSPESGVPIELEQICSGWAIGRRAQLAASKKRTLMKKMVKTVAQIDAKIVYSAAVQGDKLAQQLMSETCQVLGLAISNVIDLLHPERVILGGGVALMGPLFWDQLRREVRARTIPFFAPHVDLVRAKLKQDVVVVGALCL